MSRKSWLSLVILTVVCILLAQPVFAEVSYKWGSYMRLRHEYWKNWSDMKNDYDPGSDDIRNFFRHKTSVWGQADVTKDLTLYAKLTNEFRGHTHWQQSNEPRKKGYHFDIDEVVFDNLYFDIKNVADLPLTVRGGRQDFYGQYGENFLISDGTPQDGSRTVYFDALKASYKINKENTLDVLAISNGKTDDRLPIMNVKDTNTSRETAININDEKGLAVYHKFDPDKKLHIEDYYIYKFEEGGATKLNTDESILHTIGAYAKYDLAPFTLKGQFAVQTGTYGQEDREGFGGYFFATRGFKTKFKPTLNVGYVYLSGNDYETGKMEAWDPLFSRWPLFSDAYSEFYYLAYNTEGGCLGYWTNLSMPKLGLALVPTKNTKLTLAYYYLMANEAVPTTAVPLSGGSERNRGTLYTAKLDYTLNKHWSAFLQGEFFHPGDFYQSTADDGVFLRTQVEMKF